MGKEEARTKFEQDFNRVKDAIVAASEHRSIHYVLTNADDRPEYANVMNRYLGFFRASISAHFTSLLLTLSKALEKNTESSVSIYSLVASAEKYNLVESSALAEIKEELDNLDELVGKVRILRDKLFAHLQNGLNAEDVFRCAGITPNEIKRLIDLSIEILRKIYYSYNRGDFAFEYGSKRDTYSLLNDLQKTDKLE